MMNKGKLGLVGVSAIATLVLAVALTTGVLAPGMGPGHGGFGMIGNEAEKSDHGYDARFRHHADGAAGAGAGWLWVWPAGAGRMWRFRSWHDGDDAEATAAMTAAGMMVRVSSMIRRPWYDGRR